MKIQKIWILLFAIVFFLIGNLTGIIMGISYSNNVIQENIYAMSGIFTNNEININLNETELINQFNKTIVPVFKEKFEDLE